MSAGAPGRPLNLAALAVAGAGEPLEVPGGPLVVQELRGPYPLRADVDRWLLVLSGEVIVDLPGGDYRVLRAADALRFPAGSSASLKSVAAPAILAWHVGR